MDCSVYTASVALPIMNSAKKQSWQPVVTHGRYIRHLYVRQPFGTFYARLYQDGKNKWVSLETKVLDIAKVKLAEALQNHHTAWNINASCKEGSITVGQLARVHQQEVNLDSSIKPSTKEYRRVAVKRLFTIFPELRDMYPSQVNVTELQRRFSAGAKRYAATAINGTLDSTRAIFKLAMERGLIVKNPAESVNKLPVPAKRMVLPNAEQFKAIVEALRSSDSSSAQAQGDLVQFLAYSGCRIAEAKNVTWNDIDFSKARIYVAPAKNSHDRYVPMLSDMRDLLKRIQDVPRISRSMERRQGNFVLASTEVYQHLPTACKKVAAPRITHHDLRHLFATKCIESGVDIPTVSRWLGHLDGGTLAMRVYGHLRDDHSQAMAAKVAF
jgi:integrase